MVSKKFKNIIVNSSIVTSVFWLTSSMSVSANCLNCGKKPMDGPVASWYECCEIGGCSENTCGKPTGQHSNKKSLKKVSDKQLKGVNPCNEILKTKPAGGEGIAHWLEQLEANGCKEPQLSLSPEKRSHSQRKVKGLAGESSKSGTEPASAKAVKGK